MDTGLFELCKEVYKRTGWDDKKLGAFMKDVYPGENPMGIFEVKEPLESKYMKTQCPLYTSDYLLEKLGNYLELKHFGNTYDVTKYVNEYMFGGHADTPLKALLKLTIALDDAGELNHA
jgi:hypothetical protein